MSTTIRLLSVNVGEPRRVDWNGRSVWTGFFKHPTTKTMAIRGNQLEGDGQADLVGHGGPQKALYAYPSEHYAFWRRELPGDPLPFGSFGENLTTRGMDESFVHLGDLLRIGTAELYVTRPRFPCYKMSVRFRRDDIVRRFQASGRSGFYLGVAKAGTVRAGDEIDHVRGEPGRPTVSDAFHAGLQNLGPDSE
jgi:MOSC domain-containing protein YiiM